MKFDQLIKKSYYLLEQDENAGGQPAPDESQLKDAAEQIDKTGDKMQTQVESTFSELVNLIREMINIFEQEKVVNKQEFSPRLQKFLEDLKQSTANPNPTQCLDQIGDAIKTASSDYKPQ